MTQSTELLTLHEAGRRLGVSVKSIHKLIAVGKLRTVQVEGLVRPRIPARELERVIEGDQPVPPD